MEQAHRVAGQAVAEAGEIAGKRTDPVRTVHRNCHGTVMKKEEKTVVETVRDEEIVDFLHPKKTAQEVRSCQDLINQAPLAGAR